MVFVIGKILNSSSIAIQVLQFARLKINLSLKRGWTN